MPRTWTEAEEEHLRKRAAAGAADSAIASDLGRTLNSVTIKRQTLGIQSGKAVRDRTVTSTEATPDAREEFSREAKDETEYLFSRSRTVRTLEDLLAKAEVDLDVWEVERYTVNQWEMAAKDADGEVQVQPLYQIKAWLRRNRKAAVVKVIGEQLLERIGAARPAWKASPSPVLPADRYLWEVLMPDLHIGKLAWGAETGADYDSNVAEEVFRDALEDLIRQVSGRCVEKILFPIGNDLLQIDNLERTTTAGTPQDTDTRFAKMFVRAEGLMRHALERLSEIAPVVAPIVPGNHDRQTAFTLGRVLAAWFQGNERVTVDTSPKLRKYHRYGVNLIGYTHGSEEKPADLPLIMAQECPEDWSQTRFREWHVGHLHKMKETRYTAGDSFNGVRVRIIPSLCAADAWHAQKGYVGEIRSAEAYLWSFERGYAGHQATNVLGSAVAA